MTRQTHPSAPESVSCAPPEAPPNHWVVLARILRPQGRKGELLAELLTDFPERFDLHPTAYIAPQGFAGSAGEARAVEVSSHWLPVGRNQGRIVLGFAGIESINAAEPLSGLDVIIPATERLALEDDASYISDLLGCTLYDIAGSADPRAVGVVADVQFTTTPDGGRRLDDAAPLLAIETPDGDEVLVPFVKAFLISLDTAAKRIEMSLPEGLLDVNARREC